MSMDHLSIRLVSGRALPWVNHTETSTQAQSNLSPTDPQSPKRSSSINKITDQTHLLQKQTHSHIHRQTSQGKHTPSTPFMHVCSCIYVRMLIHT